MKSGILLFVGKKAVGGIITIFLVMSVLFLLVHSVPGGDPVTRMFPFSGGETKELLRERWGLNEPLYVQYFIYIKSVFTLNFELFDVQDKDVMEILLTLFPYTLMLFGTATVLSYLIGTFLGIRILSKESNSLKTAVTGIATFFYAVPAFVLAIFVKNWLVFRFQIFPPGTTSVRFVVFYELAEAAENIESLPSMIPEMMPALIVLVLVGLARPLLLLGDHMSLLVNEPFVLTARAKGLSETAVLSRHVARCALLPLLNDASVNLAYIVSGGIIIEYIFNWPGIGTVLFGALKLMYYPIIFGSIFLLAIILIIFMVIADILNAYLDPRVRQ